MIREARERVGITDPSTKRRSAPRQVVMVLTSSSTLFANLGLCFKLRSMVITLAPADNRPTIAADTEMGSMFRYTTEGQIEVGGGNKIEVRKESLVLGIVYSLIGEG